MLFFFFFKQKTAYEIASCLVGSEMCIRDRRRQLRNELAELRKQWTATTLFVTHDLQEAMSLGDRVAVMCDGEIHQFATPEQIQAEPASEFVAQFIAE